MKYLAILKDSLREALDSKVMYVLLGLSALIILFVGTFSFKPQSAEKTFQQFFFGDRNVPMAAIAINSHKPEKMDDLMGKRMGNMMQFRFVKVEVARGEPDAPDSDYLLTVSHQGKPGDEKVADGDEPAEFKKLRDVFRDAEDLGYFQLGDIKVVANPNEVQTHYQMSIKGTPRTFRIWAAQPSLFFGAVPIGEFSAPLGFQIYYLSSLVLSIGSWVAVLVGVVITSFFIPNMLRKGTVDLLLVKPIQRWTLLLYKFVGGLTFIFLTTTFAIGGIWFVMGIRTGLWANWSLLLIFTITFFFAILYSISTFVAVLTRSTVTAIMVTIGAWFLVYVVGTAYTIFNNQRLVEEDRLTRNEPLPEDRRWGDSTPARITYAVHAITPRTSDLTHLNDMLVYTDFMTGSLRDMDKFDTSKRNWWESLLVSTIWIGVFLGLASLWFTFKDY